MTRTSSVNLDGLPDFQEWPQKPPGEALSLKGRIYQATLRRRDRRRARALLAAAIHSLVTRTSPFNQHRSITVPPWRDQNSNVAVQ